MAERVPNIEVPVVGAPPRTCRPIEETAVPGAAPRRDNGRGLPLVQMEVDVDGVRIIVASVQQTLVEAGAPVSPPTTVATAAIAVRNPLAGHGRVDDLGELEALGREAAALLVERALAVLASVGLSPADVRGYGKGAIVGVDGDREHTAAVLHPRFGAPVRAAIGGGADIIPGTKKVAGPGALITMPIGNKDDRWVFDDMDAVDVSISDAPRPDELVITLALSAGGRPNARVRKPS